MSVYRVAVIAGDGIGPEVTGAAQQVLVATGLTFSFTPAAAGWGAFQQHGTALPAETIEVVRTSHATLFGSVSSPLSPVPGYRSPIVALRRELELFANLRPIASQPVTQSRPGIDLLIVRENTEDLYVGREQVWRENSAHDGRVMEAVAERVITRAASERVARVACEYALKRRRRLTIVHKANVLRATCGLFREACLEVAGRFAGLEVEEMLVDNAAMQLVIRPERFDVLVTTNVFGDILSDEAAALVGGLGLAPSGNVGDSAALFEPVHGSAPDIAGKGIANPVGAVLAAAMLLEHLGEKQQAERVRRAVRAALAAGVHTPDLGGSATTAELTRAIIERLDAAAEEASS